MFRRLKAKWEIESDLQLILIFIVFSISGSAALVIRKMVFDLIDFDPGWPFIFKVFVYVLTIVPAYQLMLVIIGTLFGQFVFFWKFEKKILRRFGLKFKG